MQTLDNYREQHPRIPGVNRVSYDMETARVWAIRRCELLEDQDTEIAQLAEIIRTLIQEEAI